MPKFFISKSCSSLLAASGSCLVFNKLVMLTLIGFFSGLDSGALPTESDDLFCKVDLVEGCDGTCLDLDGGREEEGDFSFLRCDEEVGGGGGGDFSFLQS